MSQILKLDAAGQPVGWLKPPEAAGYVAKGQVAWQHGRTLHRLRGGHNSHGIQSVIELPSIMAVKGCTPYKARTRTIVLTKQSLCMRDRFMCAYCGGVFPEDELEMEHILPESRGGERTWMNIVCADRRCNARKRDRTPDEAGMKLLFLPYVPNMHEGLILEGRKIIADQMEFLMSGIPRHSRLNGWLQLSAQH